MKFKAEIQILPHSEILDPQGRAAERNLPNIGINGLTNIRIGKYIEMNVAADTEEEARDKVDTACNKILTNQNTERYHFRLETLS